MTIAGLIEELCKIVGEMAELTDSLAMRLMQTGCMTEGELAQVKEIQKRLETIGISPPHDNKKTESMNSYGAGH